MSGYTDDLFVGIQHPGCMRYGVLHRIGMTLRLCKKNR